VIGRAAAVLAVLVAALAFTGQARALQLVQIGDFAAPTFVTAPPGDVSRVFVVERGGTVRVVRDGVTLPVPFLDLGAGATSTDSERGLLSLAFAADYATSGRFWIFYTNGTDGSLRVEEGRRDPANPDRALPTRVATLTLPHRQANHNGGQLAVGPDGALYIGVGDGGGANDPYDNGQNLTVRDDTGASGRHTLLGKILRIAPDPAGGYAIPAGNPFGPPAAEVWALGLRNPYRFSFDPASGAIAVADVGQDRVEEVDVIPPGVAGLNFGWSYREGNVPGPRAAPPGFAATEPVLVFPHSTGFCSIIGGAVVRDPAVPELAGRYVFGDYCLGRIWSASLQAGQASAADLGLPTIPQLSSFGEDACGRVYVTSLDGPVYRLADSGDCVVAGPIARPVDGRAPRISVRVKHRQRVLRTGVLQLRVRCDEQCTLRTGGAMRVRRRGHASAARSALALTRTRRTLAAGALVRVRLRVPARARRAVRRALARHGRKVTARLVLSATDGAGNTGRRTVLVSVRRGCPSTGLARVFV
jgi:glucose/arabinose dehydrogenase